MQAKTFEQVLQDVTFEGHTSFGKMLQLLSEVYQGVEAFKAQTSDTARLAKAREVHKKAKELAQLAFDMRNNIGDLVRHMEDMAGHTKPPRIYQGYRPWGDGFIAKSFWGNPR